MEDLQFNKILDCLSARLAFSSVYSGPKAGQGQILFVFSVFCSFHVICIYFIFEFIYDIDRHLISP